MSLRIVLLGSPGAGKGTQASRLARALRLPYIATGDIFRAHVAERTPLGKKVEDYMNSGHLVPDDLTWEIVHERITGLDCRAGFIFDGFPRSVPQAEALEEFLAANEMPLDAAIYLEVSDGEIVDRLAARRQCSTCGRIFNLKTSAPVNGKYCDQPGCTGELVRREDDCEDTIRERLRQYHETTVPILDVYEKWGLLRTVHGDQLSPDEIYRKIEEVVAGIEVR